MLVCLIASNQIVKVVKYDFEALGLNYFLFNYRTILDFPNKELILVSYDNQQDFEGYNLPGFSYDYDVGKVTVNGLTMDSDARKKGLLIGDQIIEFNGVDFRNLSQEEYCKWLMETNSKEYGEDVNLVILKDGTEQSLLIEYTMFFK